MAFTFKQALKVCAKPNTGFELKENEFFLVQLLPFCLNDVKASLHDSFEKKIGIFSEKYEGAIIAYSNIKVLGDKCKVFMESPYIHVRVEVDIIVFKPTIGCQLIGVVNKIGQSHIGLLVHGHFNASIPLSGEQQEVTVAKDTEYTFSVTGIYTHRGQLSLRGKMEQT